MFAKNLVLLCFVAVLFLTSCTTSHEGVDTTIEPSDVTALLIEETFLIAPSLEQLPEPPPQFLSWREAYAVILTYHAELQLTEVNAGWSFFLHDINQDGTPELFLVLKYETGHVRYDAVYTFLDGNAVQLKFDGVTTDGGAFALLDDSPWIVLFGVAGSGGVYQQMVIDDGRLTSVIDGWFFISDAGHEAMWADAENFDWQNYEWYDLIINSNTATADEFKDVFGCPSQRLWVNAYPISEDNINAIIFGYLELYEQSSTFQATDEIKISIAFVTDAFISEFDSVIKFDCGYTDEQRIAFIPNMPVNNFRFIEINGADIEYIVERDIYTLDTLLSEEPLVVAWMPRGSSPHRGIAFEDENDETRYFVFHYDARGYDWFRFAEFVGGLTPYCYDRWSLRHIPTL